MSQVVLIVEKNDRIRAAIRQQFLARNVPTYDVSDAFDAMSALGRAEFGAIVAAAGKRQLSLRGLCQLARRRHPSVHIFVIVTKQQAADVEKMEAAVGVQGLKMVPPETTTEQLADRVIDAMRTPFQPQMVETTSPRAEAPQRSTSARAAAPAPPPAWSTPSDEGAPVAPPAVDLPADEQFFPAATSSAPAPLDLGPLPDVPADEPLSQPDGDPVRPPLGAPTMAPAPGAQPPVSAHADVPAGVAIDLEDVDDLEDFDVEAPALEPLSQGVVLEGSLEGKVGAALLMSLAAQQFTGSLAIDSGAALGQLFLYEGDPVWATHPDGDAHLFEQLVRKGHLPPDLELAPVPAGQLLGHLTQTGHLTGKKIYEFMLAFVRDRVMALIGQEDGAYRFEEDPSFLEVAPLLKVNPFGLVLDSKRRTMTPDRLLTISSEMEWKYLYALPQLAPAVDELKPFTRDLNVAELIKGGRTVRSFCQKTGLDDLMGTLVVLSMVDARLVTIEEEMRENTNVVLSESTNIRSTRHPSAEGSLDAIGGDASAKEAQDRLMQLYMQLKPLTHPSHVLGLDSQNVTPTEVQKAYQERMAALDPKLIPEGSAQAILQAQVGELRSKVEHAYQSLIQLFPQS